MIMSRSNCRASSFSDDSASTETRSEHQSLLYFPHSLACEKHSTCCLPPSMKVYILYLMKYKNDTLLVSTKAMSAVNSSFSCKKRNNPQTIFPLIDRWTIGLFTTSLTQVLINPTYVSLPMK